MNEDCVHPFKRLQWVNEVVFCNKCSTTLTKTQETENCTKYVKSKGLQDLLNWVKSDISQEENTKLGKTSTPYRREKMKFLYKVKSIINNL